MVAPAGIGGPGRSGFASGGPWAKDFLVPSNVGRIAHPGRMERSEQPVVRRFDGIDLQDLQVPSVVKNRKLDKAIGRRVGRACCPTDPAQRSRHRRVGAFPSEEQEL